ncbi:MAG: thioredoxin domain-containing protein [Patescibacteria group bacterium]
MNAQTLATPIAIVIGFSLVAAALFLKDGGIAQQRVIGSAQDNQAAQVLGGATREGEQRNIFGSPEAPVTIVEFSDYECPFCGRLHPTLERIVNESDGQINWEYRHLPLPMHRNAVAASAIGECVAKHVGNDQFWQYSDDIFTNGNGTVAFYEAAAERVGLAAETRINCVETPEIQQIVSGDMEAARALGGSGTPFSVVVFEDGSTRPVSGALPYENWVAILGL